MSQVATESPSAIVSEIERYLDQRLETLELPPNLRDAIRYAVLGGGKRLRPRLALLCCEAVSGDCRPALGPAAALELVHGFSLVHDDLPAMDDETLRRGRPTLHIHAGEAMAILAGDAMLALAFELVIGAGLEAARSIALVRELSGASTDMIAGQVYDTLGGFPPGLNEQACLL
ncbi:MAG: polyprenyl synthetase family protein, partial [Planctomycetota bacterium]